MADAVVSGSVAAPTAGSVVVQSAALRAGLYQVGVITSLGGSGTVTAGVEDNNMALFSDTTSVGSVAVSTTKGAVATTSVAEVYVAATKTLSVKAVVNGTTSVYYSATLSIHPLALY